MISLSFFSFLVSLDFRPLIYLLYIVQFVFHFPFFFLSLDVFFDAYGELLHRTHINISEEILMESIILNTRVKIDSKMLHFEKWTAKDVFVLFFNL